MLVAKREPQAVSYSLHHHHHLHHLIIQNSYYYILKKILHNLKSHLPCLPYFRNVSETAPPVLQPRVPCAVCVVKVGITLLLKFNEGKR